MAERARLSKAIWSASIEAITVSNILFKIAPCGGLSLTGVLAIVSKRQI